MWLLDTLYCKCWRFESDAPSFLWCRGGPGTGRRSLRIADFGRESRPLALLIQHRSLVVDDLLSAVGDDAGVAYVYLDYADRQAQTVENIIASLTKQLSFC
jgi:hypothetical protein